MSASSVAYPGVPGAFSEEALLDFFRGDSVDAVGASSYDSIFSGVSDGTFAKGVVPIEDSISGTFHSVYDQLLAHKDLFVVGEVATMTECCLCVRPGVARESLTKIQSVPEILRQCSGFLDASCRGVAWLPGVNSAECARSLQESGATDTAVICSARAAQLYGLEAIDTNIGDCNVSTRYLVVAKERAELGVGERLKSSIVFALPNEPLSIFKAISAFALRGVNISKIESRPAAAVGDVYTTAYHWEYVFVSETHTFSFTCHGSGGGLSLSCRIIQYHAVARNAVHGCRALFSLWGSGSRNSARRCLRQPWVRIHSTSHHMGTHVVSCQLTPCGYATTVLNRNRRLGNSPSAPGNWGGTCHHIASA